MMLSIVKRQIRSQVCHIRRGDVQVGTAVLYPYRYGLCVMLLVLLAACAPAETTAPITETTPTASPADLPAGSPAGSGLLTDAPAALPAGLIVIWVENGALLRWEAGTTTQLIEEEVLSAFIAPGGERIALTRGKDGLAESLRVWAEDDMQPIDVPGLVNQVVWADAETLYVNTAELTALGPTPRDDLYRVNVATRAVTALPAGGQVSVQGETVFVITPGDYGGTPGQIQRLNPDDTLSPVLAFDAVATGSHFRFYPQVQWVGDTAYVALPQADALYSELAPEPLPVSLWRLTPAPVQVGTVTASMAGLPQWSGAGMVFLRREGEANQFAVYTAAIDGTAPERYAPAAGFALAPLWVNAGFVYGQARTYFWGAPGETPRPMAESDILTPPTTLSNSVVLTIFTEGQVKLLYAEERGRITNLIGERSHMPATIDAFNG
ncbi:MAG: hypothetical protein OHK0046_16040 [Anaerolineae bacterium]